MPTRVGVGAKKRRRRSAATTSRRAYGEPTNHSERRADKTSAHQHTLINAKISQTRPPHTKPRWSAR